MDKVKKFFPFSVKGTDIKSLVISIIIYIVIGFVGGLIIGLLGAIPLIGILFSIVGWVLDIYCLVGIVLAVLYFLGVVK